MIRNRHSAFSGACVFLLLGVFALCSALLVLFGAQAYRSTVDRTAAHNTARVLQSFVANAVRADDEAGAVSVRCVDGLDVLHVAYDYDGEAYGKWVYCYEGALRELFTDAQYGFEPGDGEYICEAESMELSMENQLITAVITDKYGRSHTAQIALRCAP